MTAKKKNRLALILCAAAAALCLLLACLPVAEFTTSVYTKKSGNTFVGDERYEAARAEAEAALEERRAQTGREAVLTETVTERTNSKGEKTSMVAFAVRETLGKSGWAFAGSGMTPGYVILAMAALTVLSVLTAALSGSMDADHPELPKRARRMRGAACWMALAAFLLIPVFMMTANYAFSRQMTLMKNGVELKNQDALLSQIDRFLFGGTGLDQTADLALSTTFSFCWPAAAMLVALGAMTLGQIVLLKGSLRQTLGRGFLYAFVIVLCVTILYPYYVMLITAFRSNAETTDMLFLHMMPTDWIWSNLKDIVDRGVLRYLGNSILMSVSATAVALVCGIPAAYAMARMKFKGKRAFLGFVIMSQMFSPVVLLVGISRLMNLMNLNDSLVGLMLINAAFNQAFTIWLLRGTFMSVSSEMEQAACIDGCTTVGALLRVLLPMTAPGIVTTLIFVFINAWNEYTIATVLISTPTNKPITVGITQFSSFNMIEWQYLFAAALLATIPVVILFMCIEKHLVAGLTNGGVKG